ncbi:MAG: hypothetical protein ACLFV3_06985 [Phycisphaeraceae bacterium]
MQKIENTTDHSGRPLERGDTVTTLNGYLTARISDIAAEGEMTFVRLRPLHQPYGPGTWHAADRVIWVSASNRRKKKKKKAAAEKKKAATSNSAS